MREPSAHDRGDQRRVPLRTVGHRRGSRADRTTCARTARTAQKTGRHRQSGVPCRDLRPLPGIARRPRGVPHPGAAPHRQDKRAVRPDTQGVPQLRTDLLRRHRPADTRHGLQGVHHRGRKTHPRLEIARLCLLRLHRAQAQAAAQKRQAQRRHLRPLLQHGMERISPHRRQIYRMDCRHPRGGAGVQPVHESGDIRRIPPPRLRHIPVSRSASPFRGRARRELHDTYRGREDLQACG